MSQTFDSRFCQANLKTLIFSGCLTCQQNFILVLFEASQNNSWLHETKLQNFQTKNINFLTRVQRVIHSNCSTPRGQGFVFGRLGFAIQKGLAAQLVARLPSVLM
ncbi:hypothetical protein Hanom_Chr05g00469961 [Helianthus anomalus]